jgi:hypothetical protein
MRLAAYFVAIVLLGLAFALLVSGISYQSAANSHLHGQTAGPDLLLHNVARSRFMAALGVAGAAVLVAVMASRITKPKR